MTGRRLNWHQIRAAYVEGHITDPQRDAFTRAWPTLNEVATIFGVSENTVRRRSSEEHWTDLREEFQAEVERGRRAWLIGDRIDRSTRVDDRGLQAAEGGLALVGMRLTALIHPRRGQAEEQRGIGLDARELAALGLAAKRFIDVKAHVMGQPSTAPDETLDELERQERVETRKLAEDLAEFIASRRAEEAEDAAAPAS